MCEECRMNPCSRDMGHVLEELELASFLRSVSLGMCGPAQKHSEALYILANWLGDNTGLATQF
jgi:hypothetical protein